MKKLILCSLIACGIVSCDNSGSDKIVARNDNNGDPVISVKSQDAGMNRAMDSARKTYNDFFKAFPDISLDSSKSDFSVKLRFAAEEVGAEHMWLNELYLKDNKLFGVMRGQPVYKISAKTGDTLEIDPHSVSDWMFIEKGRLIGGYTIKVLYDRMSSEEQKELEREIGAKIR